MAKAAQQIDNSTGRLKMCSSTMLESCEEAFKVDPDDTELKDTMKKARKKVGVATGIRHAMWVAQRH